MVLEPSVYALAAAKGGALKENTSVTVFLVCQLRAVDLLAAQILCNTRIVASEVQLSAKQVSVCRIELMVWLNAIFLECANAHARRKNTRGW